MKKVIFFLIPLLLAILLFVSIQFFLSTRNGKGALQVTANPKSKVYLDGKLLGETPLCKCESADMISSGTYTIRVVPNTVTQDEIGFFERKIQIYKSVLTVVDRIFANGGASSGSIITLRSVPGLKTAELVIFSFPDGAKVYLDNNLVGISPLLFRKITESDHEVKVVKDGYKEKVIRIRTTSGYKLEGLIFLGVSPNPTPSPPIASSSATFKKEEKTMVLILQTPTGFLRVRSSGSLSASEIARVNPGNTFEFISEENGWFEIKLEDGKSGWVSTSYAQKQQQ